VIVDILARSGVITSAGLSFQSLDPGVLEVIDRQNIKTERFDDLAKAFRRAGLPMYTDLILGLPGSSRTTFKNDLQEASDRELHARVFHTQLLMNSPMNAPEYRAEHGIVARPGTPVRSTRTYTEDDWFEMRRIRGAFLVADRFGALRQVSRYVRSETGTREIDFIDQARMASRRRWPLLNFLLRWTSGVMAPPVSWRFVIDEVRDYLVNDVGLAADEALATVLSVQHAVLPSARRELPVHLELAHDYAAWHAAIIEAKEDGHRHDWHVLVPPLRELPPGTLTVSDPQDICTHGLGIEVGLFSESMDINAAWELESPIQRAYVHAASVV
jgi:hypothetical protein